MCIKEPLRKRKMGKPIDGGALPRRRYEQGVDFTLLSVGVVV
jgi:hypothetical protein